MASRNVSNNITVSKNIHDHNQLTCKQLTTIYELFVIANIYTGWVKSVYTDHQYYIIYCIPAFGPLCRYCICYTNGDFSYKI